MYPSIRRLPQLLISLILLSSCALGVKPPTLDQQIYAADQAVTTILLSTDSAFNAKLITLAQAKSVSAIAHQVDPLLDAARAANVAGNTPSATSTLTLVNQLLAGLQVFIPKTP